MLIQYASDIHNNSNKYKPLPNVDIEILAGDISNCIENSNKWIKKNTHPNTIKLCIKGNHEHFTENDFTKINQFKKIYKKDNIIWLNNESITYKNIKIFGSTLWSDVTINDNEDLYNKIAINKNPEVCNNILKQTGFSITQYIKKEHALSLLALKEWLIVNHDTPHTKMVITHYPPYIEKGYENTNVTGLYFSNLKNALKEWQEEGIILPSYWIFGHTHIKTNNIDQSIQYIQNPIGYEHENTGYQNELLSIQDDSVKLLQKNPDSTNTIWI